MSEPGENLAPAIRMLREIERNLRNTGQLDYRNREDVVKPHDSLVETFLDYIAVRVAAQVVEKMSTTPDRSGVGSSDPLIGHRDAGVPPRTWRRAIKEGALSATKVGRELRARRSAVDAWLEKLGEQKEDDSSAGNDNHEAGIDDEIVEHLRAGRLRKVAIRNVGGGSR